MLPMADPPDVAGGGLEPTRPPGVLAPFPRLAPLSQAQQDELDTLYRATKDVRLRTRAQMILLVAEHKRGTPIIAALVRETGLVATC